MQSNEEQAKDEQSNSNFESLTQSQRQANRINNGISCNIDLAESIDTLLMQGDLNNADRNNPS